MFLSSWVFDEIQKEPNFNTQALRLGASETRFHPNLLLHFIIIYSALHQEKAPLAYFALLGFHYPKLAKKTP